MSQSPHLTEEIPKNLTAFLPAALVWSTGEFPVTVFILDALVAILVSATDEFPRAVLVTDAFVAELVCATDELPGAASLFGAGNFADALSFIGARFGAVECCVEPELCVPRIEWFKIAVRSA